jgi:hypothetical protein
MAISKTRGGHCYLYLLIFFKYLKKTRGHIAFDKNTLYLHCLSQNNMLKTKHPISTFQHN